VVIYIKRIYADPAPDDGLRILVDRIWPRGVTKAQAHIDEWVKDVAPSTGLRKWFAHDPQKWPVFRRRYLSELRGPKQKELLRHLADFAKRGHVTLVYGAADEEHNQAVVLRELLETSSQQ
jgi:uncharacterized protein YeaO (DUF488 family)